MPGPCHSRIGAAICVPHLLVELAVARQVRAVARAESVARSRARCPSSAARASATMPSVSGRVTPMWRGSTSIWITAARRIAPVLVVGEIEVAEARAGDENHVGLAARAGRRRAEAEDVVRVIGRDAGAAGHGA